MQESWDIKTHEPNRYHFMSTNAFALKHIADLKQEVKSLRRIMGLVLIALGVILALLLTGCTSVYVPVAKVPANVIPPIVEQAMMAEIVSSNGCSTYTTHGKTRTWCPRPIPNFTLLWNCQDDQNLTFWVQASTNLSKPLSSWPVKAIVSTNGLYVTNSFAAEFFAVRSSNSISHLMSQYATK